MKNLIKSRMFLLVMSTMVCLVIGLLAIIAVTLKSKNLADKSVTLTYHAEMIASADNLMSDIDSGDLLKAYHHALSAADYALRSGRRDIAALFREIAEKVSRGEIGNEISDEIRAIINKFEIDTQNSESDHLERRIELRKHQPISIATAKYKLAEQCANQVLGGEFILTNGNWCDGGQYLFSCDNAYVLIDEKTILPIEASVSFSGGFNNLTTDECAEIAREYLKIVYPADSAAFDSAVQVYKDDNSANVTLVYKSGSKEIKATVSTKNGRVVRFLRR